MKRDITVFYESVRISGKDREDFSSDSDGTLNTRNDEIYITYKDSLGKAVVKIKGSEISVIRFGENSNTMKFKSHTSYSFPYKTPYGVFETKIHTYTATHSSDSSGGTVSLSYTLDFSGEKSEHNFKLAYKYI